MKGNIEINGVLVYIDNYIENDKIVVGGTDINKYIIVNEYTSKLLQSEVLRELRNKKLKRILKNER